MIALTNDWKAPLIKANNFFRPFYSRNVTLKGTYKMERKSLQVSAYQKSWVIGGASMTFEVVTLNGVSLFDASLFESSCVHHLKTNSKKEKKNASDTSGLRHDLSLLVSFRR